MFWPGVWVCTMTSMSVTPMWLNLPLMWVKSPLFFFLKSQILKTVYFRSKVIIPRDAPHPKIYVHILVGDITVKNGLNSPRSPLHAESPVFVWPIHPPGPSPYADFLAFYTSPDFSWKPGGRGAWQNIGIWQPQDWERHCDIARFTPWCCYSARKCQLFLQAPSLKVQ